MAVKNLWNSKSFAGFQNCARVKSKALGVVGKIARGGTVEAVTVEKRGIVHKVELHAVQAAALQDGTKPVLIIKRYGDAGQECSGVAEFRLFIFGEVDRNAMSKFSQCFGERAYNIGEAAGLGKRHRLRRGKHNIQTGPPSLMQHPKKV